MKKKTLYLFIIIIILIIFLLYGPITYFKNTVITTSLNTNSAHWIAHILYSDKVIEEVLNNNRIIQSTISSNPELIDFKQDIYLDEYDKQIMQKDNEEYNIIEIKGKLYQGYLVAIYNPSKVELLVSKELGLQGEYITDVAKDNNSKVIMNATGFYETNYDSTGGIPHGNIIKNNELIYSGPINNIGGYIGFSSDNKLLLGKYELEEALNIYKDAIEYGPFLIVNNNKSETLGDGGAGLAPRTAIGQRSDGTVLFLVINGRLPTSIGATYNDLIEVMSNYKAVNAANLDGGSSSQLLINNEIINTPVGGGENGLRQLPTFFSYSK